jgi:hypothetical protein
MMVDGHLTEVSLPNVERRVHLTWTLTSNGGEEIDTGMLLWPSC